MPLKMPRKKAILTHNVKKKKQKSPVLTLSTGLFCFKVPHKCCEKFVLLVYS